MTATTPAALAERLEREGPSRELDAAIEVAMGFAPSDAFWVKAPEDHALAPAYTTSLDAAVAFVERVLPTHFWMVDRDRFACVETLGEVGGNATAATPAMALVAAALRALAAQGETTC